MADTEPVLPLSPVHTGVDLGAGTGALSPLLVEWADEAVAVEPDDSSGTTVEVGFRADVWKARRHGG
jgi:predicted RNA methylase